MTAAVSLPIRRYRTALPTRGVSAREGLVPWSKGLRSLDLVAFDVNTTNPLYDVGGMTAFLAATVVVECMFLAAHKLG